MIIKSLKRAITTVTIAGLVLASTGPVYGALGDQVLKNGMRHNDIMELQQELSNLGYFNFSEFTTYYGNITEDAVKEFQISRGLNPDGIFGPLTYRAFVDTLEQEKSSIEEVDSSDDEDTDLSENLVYERVLKDGVEGDDVIALKEVLVHLGFIKTDEITNIFDKDTKEALIDFQHTYKIGIDGMAGPETIKTINRILTGRIKKLDAVSRGSEGRNTLGVDIANTAKKYLGSRYVSGGAGPNSFDCSGLTQYVYKQFGISIPRSSTAQAYVGTKVSRENLQIGDLLIFSNTYKAGPSHTGIYIGNGQLVHASTSRRGVIVSDLNSAYYRKHFSYGRRLY